LQSEVVELTGKKTELQALYVHSVPNACTQPTVIIYSLSEARSATKLAEQNTKEAEKAVMEDACKLREAQRKCEFFETELEKARKECEEVKKASLKCELLEAELDKVKKEVAEREDT
jgi:hypothetical protein